MRPEGTAEVTFGDIARRGTEKLRPTRELLCQRQHRVRGLDFVLGRGQLCGSPLGHAASELTPKPARKCASRRKAQEICDGSEIAVAVADVPRSQFGADRI